jgi:transposase InsO family protein
MAHAYSNRGASANSLIGGNRLCYSCGVNRLAQVSPTQTGYFLADVLDSVRQIANGNTPVNIVLAQTYTPYGEVLESYGAGVSGYVFQPPCVAIFRWRQTVAGTHLAKGRVFQFAVPTATQARNRLHALLHRHHIAPPNGNPFLAEYRSWWLDLPVSKLEKVNMQSDLDTLDFAAKQVYHRPRLLSDNGPAYHSKDLAAFLTQWRMDHIHGAPYHPTTQGKIERWHRSMKSVVKLQNYYTPPELRQAIVSWVDYYNNERFHESLDNVTPADVYFDRREEILKERNELKEMTMELRRQRYYQLAGV